MTQSAPLRVGIIGCGRIATSHADALVQLKDDFELVAAADPDAERCAAFAKRYALAHTFADDNDLISAGDIDAVVICSPNSMHADQAVRALDSGKHVLVEKPMADNAQDAQVMADAASRSGLVLALGHTFRHCDAVRYVQDHLDDFGPLRAVEVSMCVKWNGPQTAWWAERTLDEGLILSLFAPHALDFVQMIMKDDPLRVHVEAARHQQEWRGEDEAMIVLAYPGRRMASVHVSYDQDYVVNRKTLHCANAFVLVEDNERVWVNEDLVVSPETPTMESSHKMGGRNLNHYFADQLREFALAIRGEPHRCILHDEGVRFTTLLDRVLSGARETSREAVE